MKQHLLAFSISHTISPPLSNLNLLYILRLAWPSFEGFSCQLHLPFLQYYKIKPIPHSSSLQFPLTLTPHPEGFPVFFLLSFLHYYIRSCLAYSSFFFFCNFRQLILNIPGACQRFRITVTVNRHHCTPTSFPSPTRNNCNGAPKLLSIPIRLEAYYSRATDANGGMVGAHVTLPISSEVHNKLEKSGSRFRAFFQRSEIKYAVRTRSSPHKYFLNSSSFPPLSNRISRFEIRRQWPLYSLSLKLHSQTSYLSSKCWSSLHFARSLTSLTAERSCGIKRRWHNFELQQLLSLAH